MALTAEQKKDIRKYMGVPFGFYYLSQRLEGMMDLVGQDAVAEAQIITWLTRLATIDAALTGSAANSTATYGALKKVDEIEFYPVSTDSSGSSGASLSFVSQGRTLIDRIARALGVYDFLPIGDYFSSRTRIGFTIPLG